MAIDFSDAGNGFMVKVAEAFEKGGEALFASEKAQRAVLSTQEGSSDASELVKYQAIISEVTILRNAQSSTVKAFKDIDATIVANFR